MLDTRELQTEREDLEQQILDSFLQEFPQYEDMTDNFEDIRFEEEEIESWKEEWLDEIVTITDIEKLEYEIGSEWEYGVTLIEEDEFEDYCEEFVEDCYGLKDVPSLIRNNINWEGVVYDMRQDYSEVVYNGNTYLYR
jgi:hypothetical protein